MWLLIHATRSTWLLNVFSDEVKHPSHNQLHNGYMMRLSSRNSWWVCQSSRSFSGRSVWITYSAENDCEFMWVALTPIPFSEQEDCSILIPKRCIGAMPASLHAKVIAWYSTMSLPTDGVFVCGVQYEVVLLAYMRPKMTVWGSDRNLRVTWQSKIAEYIDTSFSKAGWSDDQRHPYASLQSEIPRLIANSISVMQYADRDGKIRWFECANNIWRLCGVTRVQFVSDSDIIRCIWFAASSCY